MRRYTVSRCKYGRQRYKPMLAYQVRRQGAPRVITAWEFLTRWPPFLPSVEGKQPLASKSEMRRWFERKSIHINGIAASMDTVIECEDKVVLHPKGKHRTTLQ